MVTLRSRRSYQETLATLTKAIADHGNTVFATIDQSAAAATVGMQLRPTALIVFGNPRGGTPLMEAFPLVALELPLKLLIWEDQDGSKIAYAPMSEIAQRYGVTGMDARIAAMDAAVDQLVGSVRE